MNVVQPIRDTEKLKEFAEEIRKKSERDYILFMLGTYTGLRISDILKLKVKDVRNQTHIVIKEQKTSKRKEFSINPVLNRDLKEYIQSMDNGDYLIQSRQRNKGKKKSISRQQAYNILNAVADSVGLEHIGTHTLRKTFGYHYYKQTKDIAMLQDLFNHASPKITLIYIGIDRDLRDKAINKFRYW